MRLREAGGDWQPLDLTTMKVTMTPRNQHPQRKALELSDLNDDVLFEILLQFVAVDLDGGPFTLMLVCTKWRELALSKPRLWTWMLVDDSQTDWKERMEVAASLSRGLPLQIRLRLRFTTDIPISHVVRRCETLYVDCRQLYLSYYPTPGRWQSETTATYETFSWSVDILKELNDDVMRFLIDVPTSRIKISSADPDRGYFMYSAREIYEGIATGNSVKTLLQMAHPFLLTALVFKHGKKTKSHHIHFEIGEVWAILPTLPHLRHLEFWDTFVNLDRRTILPGICLPSLCTLVIDCPMSHWVFFSFVHDIWLGLLNTLNFLEAPSIEVVRLHSSIQRIKAAMTKASIRPHDLILTISTFDEAEDEPKFDQNWIWKGLTRTTINLPKTAQAFTRLTMPEGLVFAIRSLLAFLPKGTSKRFRGGGELDAIAQAYIPDIEDLDLFYTHSRPLQYTFRAKSVISLTLKTLDDDINEPFYPPYPSNPPYLRWLKSVEHIFLEDDQSVRRCLEAYHLHVVEPALKSWDSQGHSGWHYDEKVLSKRRASFSFLTTLRATESVASELVSLFDTPYLQSITLAEDEEYEGDLRILLETLLKHAFQLKQLKILGMEYPVEWSCLFDFLINFQNAQREISTINISGPPHPFILQQLVTALQGVSSIRPPWTSLGEPYDKLETERRVCRRCIMNGSICYEGECGKFPPGEMVSITKDTIIGHYHHEKTFFDEGSADPIEEAYRLVQSQDHFGSG